MTPAVVADTLNAERVLHRGQNDTHSKHTESVNLLRVILRAPSTIAYAAPASVSAVVVTRPGPTPDAGRHLLPPVANAAVPPMSATMVMAAASGCYCRCSRECRHWRSADEATQR
eukprot:m.424374 g.424374  ORF g.424374 m.424374 type:complete len:115 (-) comp46554_c0_seq1:304-648(-)